MPALQNDTQVSPVAVLLRSPRGGTRVAGVTGLVRPLTSGQKAFDAVLAMLALGWTGSWP